MAVGMRLGPGIPLSPDDSTSMHSFRRRRRSLWGYGIIIVVYAILSALWSTETLPPKVYVAGVAVVALSLLPSVLWYLRGCLGLPVFELICISYGVNYGTPVFIQLNQINAFNDTVQFQWDETFMVLILVSIGLSAMITAYYRVRRTDALRGLQTLDLPLSPRGRSAYLLWALFVGGIVMALQDWGIAPSTAGPLGALTHVISNQFYVAVIILAYMVYTPGTASKWKVLLYAAVAFGGLVGLTTGSLENALVPCVLFIAVRWQTSKRIPVFILLVFAVLFIVLQSAKFEYRQQAWFSGNDPSITRKLTLWADAVGSISSGTSGTLLDPLTPDRILAIRTALNRLDLLHDFVLVYRLTPVMAPYFHGSTYDYFLYSLIPRLVWPEKPIAQQANITFEIQYGLVAPSQVNTTMDGIGQIAEAYANFGVFGVVVIMALEGMVFGLLDRVLNGPASDGAKAIYLSIMIFFLNGIGGSTAAMFGAIAQSILANAVILYAFSRVVQHPQERADE